QVIVATDDERIEQACESFGARVVLTDPACPSGTDRVAQVAQQVEGEIFVNVQGDEPEIEPEAIDTLIALMEGGPDMATLAVRCHDPEAFASPAVVKALVSPSGRALYFTRATAPFDRERRGAMPEGGFLRHLGIYAYTREFLAELCTLPPSPLEQIEHLEQLRVLEAGRTIQVGEVARAAPGIDTEEDYQAFAHRWHMRQGSSGAKGDL
ncbi:MAG: 3-deoxy-manno-octulosonate cytidylyltransferase, partial [Planctomycetota bacterium]